MREIKKLNLYKIIIYRVLKKYKINVTTYKLMTKIANTIYDLKLFLLHLLKTRSMCVCIRSIFVSLISLCGFLFTFIVHL